MGIAIKLTIEGINQAGYFQTWVFAVVSTTCIVIQLLYLNKVHFLSHQLHEPVSLQLFTKRCMHNRYINYMPFKNRAIGFVKGNCLRGAIFTSTLAIFFCSATGVIVQYSISISDISVLNSNVCVPLLKDIYRYYFLTRKYELILLYVLNSGTGYFQYSSCLSHLLCHVHDPHHLSKCHNV